MEALRKDDDYLLHYRPAYALAVLCLPMMVGAFFQQFYTMADSVIVGRFVGEDALAAVGASCALTNVFIAIAIGGGNGAGVLVSYSYGSREWDVLKEAVSTALLSFLAISAALGAAGYIASPWIMGVLNTPGNIMAEAVAYLEIYFLGLPFLFMYNILSSVFNALGKSRIPLFLLIFSSVLNIFLDLAAVIAFGMGVEGAAWATLASQAVSALLSYLILRRTLAGLDGRAGMLFSWDAFRKMASTAVPSIVQQGTISFGMMLVQSVVNLFGSQVLAGYSAAIRVDSLAGVPLSSMGNAMSPYTAQNLGAKQYGRVGRGYRAGLLYIAGAGIAICLVLQLFRTGIMELFLGDAGTEAAYRTGEDYLSFLGWFYAILGFAMVTGGVLRGAGKMAFFTLGSILNLSFRVIGSMALAPRFGVEVVWYVVPIGWTIYLVACLAGYRRLGRH